MINQIEEETGSLPSNLPRGVAPEVAAENPDVQAIIAPRLTMLMEIANSFLLTIIESMDSVPYGIRWICKQIRSLTRVRGSQSSYLSLTPYFSENIPKQLTMPFAHSSVAFSSFDLSTQPLSHHKHICLLKAFLPSIPVELSLWFVVSNLWQQQQNTEVKIDCKNATKSCQQAFVFEGGIYDDP